MHPNVPLSDTASSASHRRRRRTVIGLAALGAAAAAITAWSLPSEKWTELLLRAEEAAAWVRTLGPAWFFSAFAILTAFGFPVTFFALSAGPLFAPVLGMPTVLALAAACLATSMTTTYLLARYAFRPWVARCLDYLGYTIPEIPPKRRRLVVLLVRVTPGPPYVLQSALLGMASVPFRVYFPISFLVCSSNVLLLILFGAALARGSLFIAGGALLALTAAAWLVRHFRRRAQIAAAA